MSQHTGSHKNSLNLLGEKYLNESHWPMRPIIGYLSVVLQKELESVQKHAARFVPG